MDKEQQFVASYELRLPAAVFKPALNLLSRPELEMLIKAVFNMLLFHLWTAFQKWTFISIVRDAGAVTTASRWAQN